MILVPELLPEQVVPKEELLEFLKEEAPHFMFSLLNAVLPEPTGRLRLPVVVTEAKREAQEANETNFAWAEENYGILEIGEPDQLPAKRLAKADVYADYQKAFPKGLGSEQFFRKLSRWARGKERELGDGYGPTIPGVEGRTSCYTRLYKLPEDENNKVWALVLMQIANPILDVPDWPD